MKLHQIKLGLQAKLDEVSGRDEGWIIDDDNRDCLRRVSEWIHEGDYRRGFTLRGPVGTGKSRVVEAAGRVLIALHGKGIRRIEAVELVNIVAKAKGDRSVLEKYADHVTYPFLWIEDLDTEGNAPSFVTGDGGINCVAELVQVRYKRWEQGLKITTGFTTNATNSRLLERYGERCCSRMNHMAQVIPLPGPDRRAQNATLPNVQQRIEFHQPATSEVATAALSPILAEFQQAHDLRVLERNRNEAERKAKYLDELRMKVRRLQLAELHQVIQTDVFSEARDIARNQFNSVSPITYDQFCEQLETARTASQGA
jgi:DNA replication protein DnaC